MFGSSKDSELYHLLCLLLFFSRFFFFDRIMHKYLINQCATLVSTSTTPLDAIPVVLSPCDLNNEEKFQNFLLHAREDFLNVQNNLNL